MINSLTIHSNVWKSLIHWSEVTGEDTVYFDCDKKILYAQHNELTLIFLYDDTEFCDTEYYDTEYCVTLPDKDWQIISFRLPSPDELCAVITVCDMVIIDIEGKTMTFKFKYMKDIVHKNFSLKIYEDREKAENFARTCNLAATAGENFINHKVRTPLSFLRAAQICAQPWNDYVYLHSGDGVMVAHGNAFRLIAES